MLCHWLQLPYPQLLHTMGMANFRSNKDSEDYIRFVEPCPYPIRIFALSYWTCRGMRGTKGDGVQRVQEECRPRPVRPRGLWGWRQYVISKCCEPITPWYSVTSQKTGVFNHSAVITLRLANRTIPLACAECDDSLPFSGASSIPLCYVVFPATLLHQLFFHLLLPHLAIYFLVYLSILLFQNSYIIPFWEFYFLPFSVHAQTNVIYLT